MIFAASVTAPDERVGQQLTDEDMIKAELEIAYLQIEQLQEEMKLLLSERLNVPKTANGQLSDTYLGGHDNELPIRLIRLAGLHE